MSKQCTITGYHKYHERKYTKITIKFLIHSHKYRIINTKCVFGYQVFVHTNQEHHYYKKRIKNILGDNKLNKSYVKITATIYRTELHSKLTLYLEHDKHMAIRKNTLGDVITVFNQRSLK